MTLSFYVILLYIIMNDSGYSRAEKPPAQSPTPGPGGPIARRAATEIVYEKTGAILVPGAMTCLDRIILTIDYDDFETYGVSGKTRFRIVPSR